MFCEADVERDRLSVKEPWKLLNIFLKCEDIEECYVCANGIIAVQFF